MHPIIGAVSGLIIFEFMRSGILNFKSDIEDDNLMHLILSIAFISGFSDVG
jgi:hypothetical protein